MIWTILLAFLLVVGFVSIAGRKQVPWAGKLQRRNAGVQAKAEWMAPEPITKTVQDDYLRAVEWLSDSMLYEWAEQWTGAPHYLSGPYLHRYQELLKRYRMGKSPRYEGVMRCTHRVEVRHFSEDGERCLIVDHQSSRRIATYDLLHQSRMVTQDMGDGTVVYEMSYDKQLHRWKIEAFIQELPTGCTALENTSVNGIQLLNALPPANGRDH